MDPSSAKKPSAHSAYCMRCGSRVEDLPQGCKTRCPVCDFPYPQGSCSD